MLPFKWCYCCHVCLRVEISASTKKGNLTVSLKITICTPIVPERLHLGFAHGCKKFRYRYSQQHCFEQKNDRNNQIIENRSN